MGTGDDRTDWPRAQRSAATPLSIREPERYVSAFIDGAKRMECTFTPTA